MIDKDNEIASLAPVYDNGACLYPQLTEEQMKKILKIKINYVAFLMSTRNKECLRAFAKVSQRIDLQKINHIISERPVPDINKKFYSHMLFHRKTKIIDVIMERIKMESLVEREDLMEEKIKLGSECKSHH